jgi:hypothetical protein
MVQQTDIYTRVPQLPGGFCDKIALPYSPECPPNPLPSVPLLATQKFKQPTLVFLRYLAMIYLHCCSLAC